MFGSLFLKECKETFKSITYLVYLLAVVVYFFTQMDFRPLKPEPDQDYYGHKSVDDENMIKQLTIENLLFEYNGNQYTTYPIGFYKQVILNEEKQKEVKKVIETVTGKSMVELEQLLDDYYNGIELQENGTYVESVDFAVAAADGISYDEFLDYMDQVDKLLGGGSNYARERVKNSQMPMSYEDALQEYEDILEKDKITGAYARLFSDYMGLLLGIMPVFLAVARQLRDKKSKSAEVIGSKSISSIKIVLSRYTSNVLMAFLPVVGLSIYALLQLLYMGSYLNVTVDMTVLIIYCFGWLLPSILFTLSIGFFLTELTNSALAILFQGIFWFASVFVNMNYLVGAIGFNLIPRFNALGEHKVFEAIFPELVWNRLLYAGVGIVLLILTILVFDYHRKGGKSHAGRRNLMG